VLQQDKSAIDALEREVAQLRAALQRRETTGAAANGHDASSGDKLLEQKLKERERSITELNRTIKDHEAAIKKLTETAESWKRKYQFLATEAPDAYKAAAEK
jgi:prefoldin subunit 5